MNVQNNLQGLHQLLAGQEVSGAAAGKRTGASAGVGTDETTLSAAGSAAAQTAPDSDVRMEKVAAVQKALAAGTYNVPSSDVADKMIDTMLGG